jgi:hypothetical protein
VTDPAPMPVREARPRSPKPPRWSAERRASRVMGRKAPRLGAWRAALRARPTGALAQHPNVSRRSAHPSSRGERSKGQSPGAKNALREREGLFEMVNRVRARPRLLRVPGCDAARAQRSGASLIRDRRGLERSRVCSAPLRCAPGTRERRDRSFVCDRWAREEPTCGCRKRPPTRVSCFRPVIYRELCNENV